MVTPLPHDRRPNRLNRSTRGAAVALLTLLTVPPLAAVDGEDVATGAFGIFGFDLGGNQMDLGLACAVQADGKLVMAGSAVDDDGEGTKIAVARRDVGGGPDAGFGTLGKRTIDFSDEGYTLTGGVARAVLLGDFGFLYVVGHLHNPTSGQGMAFVTRLHPNGTIDYNWRYNGITGGWYFSSHLEVVSTAALDPAGNIWIVGPENRDLTEGWAYIQLDQAGTELAAEAFPVTGSHDSSAPTAILFQPDSKPVFGGFGLLVGPPIYATPMLVRLLGGPGDPVLDSTFGFNNDGWLILDYVGSTILRSLAQRPDGKLVIAGESGAPGAEDVLVQRLTANGIADGSFEEYIAFDVGGTGGDGGNGFIRMVAQSDGKVVVAARVLTGDANNKSDVGVARLLTNNQLDTSFGGNGTGKRVFSLSNPPPGTSDDRIDCLVLDAGKPIVGGAGEYISPDTDFAFRRLTNSLIFADGYESGSSFFWSNAAL